LSHRKLSANHGGAAGRVEGNHMKRRSESAPALARPIIIDCDPGTDDAIALWLALASPEIALQAITVVGGNVGIERTLANALALVALAVFAAAAAGALLEAWWDEHASASEAVEDRGPRDRRPGEARPGHQPRGRPRRRR
jgi:hypothetical protein